MAPQTTLNPEIVAGIVRPTSTPIQIRRELHLKTKVWRKSPDKMVKGFSEALDENLICLSACDFHGNSDSYPGEWSCGYQRHVFV